jgi:hypothetical protein
MAAIGWGFPLPLLYNIISLIAYPPPLVLAWEVVLKFWPLIFFLTGVLGLGSGF